MSANPHQSAGPDITAAFVDKVRAICWDSLPHAAVEVARQAMLDTLAVTLAGARETSGVARISMAYARETGGAPCASVIAGGFKTSMQNAAYVNGTLAHVLEFDAAWSPPNHPASPTLPAIMAVAEHYRLPGTKIIEAVVAAFEVQARVRLAATGMPAGDGFHKPGVTGLFGAAAGVARLLDLGQQQMRMALGLAGSRAGSMAINSGTMTKSSHAGHAARMGIECAILARAGWTASPEVFGPGGFFDTFMPGDSQPQRLIEGFAAPLRMIEPGVGFKAYPCVYFTHRAIDAALELRQRFDIRAAQVESVHVRFARFEYVDRPQPRSGLDAKYSLQYATLIALLDGEVSMDSFSDERLRSNDVLSLLPRVHFEPDDAIPAELERMHTTVTVVLKDGRKMSQHVEKLSGWMGTPLTPEQQRNKFFSCARHVLEDGAAQRMLALVEKFESLAEVGELMDIARCGDGQA